MLSFMIVLALLMITASAMDLPTFIPLVNESPTSTAFFALSTPVLAGATPFACIDSCFNNATGGGKSACFGVSGQYQCICTFPAMMEDFETCMSTKCDVPDATVQETLGNVQQICQSCTSDGCNTFSISAGGNAGGTLTFTPSAESTQSVCYSSTQSSSFTVNSGGVAGGGFQSVGRVPCGPLSQSSTPLPSGSALQLSDAASPGPSTTVSSSASGLSFFSSLWVAFILAEAFVISFS
ncbi:hypothetical protein C8J57DRAFT_1354395 [Mycena rebaudengoi]|nr:hypothetical protein C8J57DRAFT_1354395 [Mycena rebaudengoi]